MVLPNWEREFFPIDNLVGEEFLSTSMCMCRYTKDAAGTFNRMDFPGLQLVGKVFSCGMIHQR